MNGMLIEGKKQIQFSNSMQLIQDNKQKLPTKSSICRMPKKNLEATKRGRRISPGSVASCHTCLTDSMSLSIGACITIVVEPTRQRTQPTTPKI